MVSYISIRAQITRSPCPAGHDGRGSGRHNACCSDARARVAEADQAGRHAAEVSRGHSEPSSRTERQRACQRLCKAAAVFHARGGSGARPGKCTQRMSFLPLQSLTAYEIANAQM
eukprot:6203664-Pleurochrysis_carterae.AAC.2